MRIDVFTLAPQAFAWMCEQRPVAAVLGSELDLRIFNYRDFTPLRAGQVDDEPYGGGAGMLVRVDVVDAALQAAYGDETTALDRIIALSPTGRLLDQAYVEALSNESHIAILSARFEGFDARVTQHLATETLSIGPYVLSGGEIPAMAVIDALTRHLPGALGSAESINEETFSEELGGGHEYPHYTRPAEYRGWEVPEVLRSGDHARIAAWRRDSSADRSVA
ncbi:MAG: tRNA (guanosine(37)-N1)-methyltransferase TrmD [Gaiellaceae bacterium]